MSKDLKKAFEDAEAKGQKLQAERDEAIQKVRDRFDDKLKAANAEAAEAQKAMLDAEVRESLKDRPDGQAIADSLGIKLDD